MGRPTVAIELANNAQLARDLSAGGVFVQGYALSLTEDVELVVRGPGGELVLAARVVYVAPTGGAGLELVGFNAELKERIAALSALPPLDLEAPISDEPASATPAAEDGSDAEPEGDEGADEPGAGKRTIALNINERLRGLTLAQQIKKANSSDPNERTVLERMYGKNVWEALLRNPRLTAPEVARIARMGTLPRIMLEQIVNNGAWLQIPEVRRALLGNPRLGTDQILRVLRLLPKHELKLATATTAYPMAVRDAAKRMLKDD